MKPYPNSAGYKEGETSKRAAEIMDETGKARTIAEQIYGILAGGREASCYDLEEILGYSQFSLRPRLSELQAQGKIRKVRKQDISGGRQVWVWGVVSV